MSQIKYNQDYILTDAGTEAYPVPRGQDHAPSGDLPDPLSLRQAGQYVSSTSELTDTSRPSSSKKELASSQTVAMEGLTADVQTDTSECVAYKMEDKPKGIVFPSELVLSVSPDSGTEMSVPVERDRPEMELLDVSTAREEVAMLAEGKQRLQIQHTRLERLLRENRASVAEVREVSMYVCSTDNSFFAGALSTAFQGV